MIFRLLPFVSCEIHSALSPEKIQNILRENTEPKVYFRASHEHKYFEGEVSKEEFRINRIIHYRNSFLPRIFGTIVPRDSGSVVKIKMKLHNFVTAFLGVWFGGIIFASIALFRQFSLVPSDASNFNFIPFGMFVFGIAIVSGGFWFEASKQKKKLIEMLSSVSASSAHGA